MIGIYIYGSIIAAILLYVNSVTILVKVKNGEHTVLHTIIGSIISGFIMYCFIMFFHTDTPTIKHMGFPSPIFE
ncbi:MAG TPA: hypothetical protein DD811_14765 [Syntrophomonas sp.]|jgi:uncharacterized membrane-anchored protein|nr:hypothetical protein [Syntrophomonas sp.]